MFSAGEIITYLEMCGAEDTSLQAGMNFQLVASHSVVLMSRRTNAPYRDEVVEDGTVILYEGHVRDRGQCVLCGTSEEIHFDHELPFSRGGSSSVENIRILCARHNLTKGARIE